MGRIRTTITMNDKVTRGVIDGDKDLQKFFNNVASQYARKIANALDLTHKKLYPKGIELWYKGAKDIDGKPDKVSFRKEIKQHGRWIKIRSIATPQPYITPGLHSWINRHAGKELSDHIATMNCIENYDDFNTLKLHYAFDMGYTGLPPFFRRPPIEKKDGKGYKIIPIYMNGETWYRNNLFQKGAQGKNLRDYLMKSYYVKQGRKVFNTYCK